MGKNPSGAEKRAQRDEDIVRAIYSHEQPAAAPSEEKEHHHKKEKRERRARDEREEPQSCLQKMMKYGILLMIVLPALSVVSPIWEYFSSPLAHFAVNNAEALREPLLSGEPWLLLCKNQIRNESSISMLSTLARLVSTVHVGTISNCSKALPSGLTVYEWLGLPSYAEMLLVGHGERPEALYWSQFRSMPSAASYVSARMYWPVVNVTYTRDLQRCLSRPKGCALLLTDDLSLAQSEYTSSGSMVNQMMEKFPHVKFAVMNTTRLVPSFYRRISKASLASAKEHNVPLLFFFRKFNVSTASSTDSDSSASNSTVFWIMQSYHQFVAQQQEKQRSKLSDKERASLPSPEEFNVDSLTQFISRMTSLSITNTSQIDSLKMSLFKQLPSIERTPTPASQTKKHAAAPPSSSAKPSSSSSSAKKKAEKSRSKQLEEELRHAEYAQQQQQQEEESVEAHDEILDEQEEDNDILVRPAHRAAHQQRSDSASADEEEVEVVEDL